MANYEYKVLYGKPSGTSLMPWASQKVRDEIGPGSFEKKLNQLAEDGWEVVSCTTATAGNILYQVPMATAVLQRKKDPSPTKEST